jgi:hypothetical protein
VEDEVCVTVIQVMIELEIGQQRKVEERMYH